MSAVQFDIVKLSTDKAAQAELVDFATKSVGKFSACPAYNFVSKVDKTNVVGVNTYFLPNLAPGLVSGSVNQIFFGACYLSIYPSSVSPGGILNVYISTPNDAVEYLSYSISDVLPVNPLVQNGFIYVEIPVIPWYQIRVEVPGILVSGDLALVKNGLYIRV